MPRLVLIDGSSYLYRAFHALPPLSAPDGTPTGALHGVINMLRATLQEKPDCAAFVVDASGPTFRDAMYDQYKANREAMPDDLRTQIEPMLLIVEALGFPILRVSGVEADDVIGTLALEAQAAGVEVTISTGDKDFAQLVRPGIILVNTMKTLHSNGSRLDSDASVVEKFGVRPNQIIDLLALMGDTADNIPGVDKCGPKTAAKWLAEYGTLDNVMTNADKVSGKIGENLRAALPRLPLSRQLATIKTDVPLELPHHALKLREKHIDELRVLFARYGFKQALRELGEPSTGTSPAPTESLRGTAAGHARSGAAEENLDPALAVKGDYECISTQAQLDEWIEKLRGAELIAFDTETDALDPMRANLVGISFAVEIGKACYIPLAHIYPGAPAQLDRAGVLAALRPILEDAAKPKVGQHGKYDLHVLRRHGVDVRGYAQDTMLESFVFNATATRHDMDSLALRYLGYTTVKYAEVTGKGAKQILFSQVALDDATRYAAEDSDVTLRLHHALHAKLAADAALERVYREIEMPLVPVLERIEANGVLVDAAELRRQSHDLGKRMHATEQQAHAIAGRPFNLDSTKQLQAILFDELKLNAVLKTPGGQPSTNEEALEAIAEDHALPRLILDYRSLSKLRSTYTEKLPEAINPETGRVHTSYHQAGAATGRLASSDPNLQNIPDPHRRRPPHPQGLHRASGKEDRRLRLLADRAADHGAPVRGSRPGACVRKRARCASRDSSRSVRCRIARSGQWRPTPCRKGDQFRPDVRHERFRSRAPARHRARRGAGLYRTVLREVSRCARLHGPHAGAGQAAGLCRNRVRPAPVPARHQCAQPGLALGRRARGDQCADAGHRRRHHQTRDGRGGCVAATAGGTRADDHAGARRTGLRGRRGLRRNAAF